MDEAQEAERTSLFRGRQAQFWRANLYSGVCVYSAGDLKGSNSSL